MKRSLIALLSIAVAMTLVHAIAGASRKKLLKGPVKTVARAAPEKKVSEQPMGSAARGKKLFLDRKRLQCGSCHPAKDGEPDDIGPNLAKRLLSRQRVLVAILDPSKEFAPGFKHLRVQLSDGTLVDGDEDESRSDGAILALKVDDGTTRLISRDSIEEMQIGPSTMPEGQAADLSPEELADLVAFVTSLGAETSLKARAVRTMPLTR